MINELVEYSSDGSSGFVRASNDQDIALSPEITHREAIAGYVMFGVEIIPKVFVNIVSPCLVHYRA